MENIPATPDLMYHSVNTERCNIQYYDITNDRNTIMYYKATATLLVVSRVKTSEK